MLGHVKLTILICNCGIWHHALAQMIGFGMSEQYILTAVKLLLDVWDRKVLDCSTVSMSILR